MRGNRIPLMPWRPMEGPPARLPVTLHLPLMSRKPVEGPPAGLPDPLLLSQMPLRPLDEALNPLNPLHLALMPWRPEEGPPAGPLHHHQPRMPWMTKPREPTPWASTTRGGPTAG